MSSIDCGLQIVTRIARIELPETPELNRHKKNQAAFKEVSVHYVTIIDLSLKYA